MHEIAKKGERYKTIKLDVHPKFHNFAMMERSDLAIPAVERKISFNQKVQPICLLAPEEDYTGMKATVAGW